ncbi:MAG: fused MFS/spermidine synthase [Pseudomonadales bacterium]|nr:fused MFS/spermidine synthase [Pseudomonadales bacterium]
MHKATAQAGYHSRLDVLVLTFILTLFTSAFLLFQIQPIISKTILPWYGGSSMVWSTCLLFFQVVLLLGYTYAHLLTKLTPHRQASIHVCLIVVACTLLPITPDPMWKPQGEFSPTWHILSLLATHVGLPYFLLSATSPLVQVWYGQIYESRSPYRLYALSNLGSMLALLSYPFIVEPSLDTITQGHYWSVAFVIFSALVAYLTILILKSSHALSTPKPQRDKNHVFSTTIQSTPIQSTTSSPELRRHNLGRQFLWFILPACASVTLLAITNHLSQDVAVIPFLWIFTLSLYLLSFILCFDHPRWYNRNVFASATIVLSVFLGISSLEESLLFKPSFYYYMPNLAWDIRLEVGIYTSLLFLICMLCHGELTRQKPSTSRLSYFYLLMSAGSAAGAAWVCLICPIIFSSYVELKIGIASSVIIATTVLVQQAYKILPPSSTSIRSVTVVGLIMITALGTSMIAKRDLIKKTESIAKTRNFYGVLSVHDLSKGSPHHYRRALYHGRILHGMQVKVPGREQTPTQYYANNSGIGITMQHYSAVGSTTLAPRRVGVIGLGTGSLAVYGRSQDTFRFYEINPQMVTFSKKYFSFLQSTPAEIEIVLGDGRLSLESEPPQKFDILVLDAFSGDSVPIHLLTVEAFELYLTHLREGGVIAVHVSNRHLDLSPVVAGLSKRSKLSAIEVYLPDTGKRLDTTSTWMLVTRNEGFLNHKAVVAASLSGRKRFEVMPVWSDKYSSLFDVLNY